ncbi:MAG: hypothetical protein HY097_05835 [Nitrospinae bacterium]|nr:hypothetical protein [Nitrospinota bacterium]
MPSVTAESKKDESYTEEVDIDEFLNELEEKKAESPDPESTGDSGSDKSGSAQGSVAEEEKKEAEPNLKDELPIFSDEEFVPLDTDIKGGGILSQEEMNKLLAGSLELAPKENIGGEKALIEGMELPTAPPDTTSLQAGDGGEVDLDKLMEDTAMGIGDVQKGSAVSGEAIPVPSKFDEAMKKASESLDVTMVSSENLETEVHRPVSDTAVEDVSPIDVMADLEEEFKPKDAGFFGKIPVPAFFKRGMERVQYLIFFISSYLSRLRGRFFKKPAQQDSTGLTEGPSADLAEAHPGKIKITWKLIVLSFIILAILAGGIGVIVVVGKKWMSSVKEKEEIVAVKERPSAKRPHVEEKKPVVSEANLTEEPVKPLETEKPPEIEKKPEPSREANLTESQQPSQAEIQTTSTPPAPPVPEERLARLGIILPVSFSSEDTKVMTMNIKLEFDNKETADTVKKDPLYYEGIVEDSVEQFFRDKFYEDTHFVREKLKEVVIRHLNENIKNGRIKKVEIEELKVK